EEVHFDAVLHDSHDEDGVHLAPIGFPRPMFGLAVQASSRGQEQKLSQALRKLAEEDPAFVVEHNVEVNETVIRGLSELHLRVMLERLKDRFGLEVTARPPRIAYRETISVPAEGHHRHKKQTGGAGRFAEVFLRVEPLERGAGLERVVVHDGRHHPVDSKEVAFATAGRKAFLDAVSKARPLVLEPVVALEVWAPEAQLGDVTGALATRRARIAGTDGSGNNARSESV